MWLLLSVPGLVGRMVPVSVGNLTGVGRYLVAALVVAVAGGWGACAWRGLCGEERVAPGSRREGYLLAALVAFGVAGVVVSARMFGSDLPRPGMTVVPYIAYDLAYVMAVGTIVWFQWMLLRERGGRAEWTRLFAWVAWIEVVRLGLYVLRVIRHGEFGWEWKDTALEVHAAGLIPALVVALTARHMGESWRANRRVAAAGVAAAGLAYGSAAFFAVVKLRVTPNLENAFACVGRCGELVVAGWLPVAVSWLVRPTSSDAVGTPERQVQPLEVSGLRERAEIRGS